MRKILVIMATYNGEKYLVDQINSILSQVNVVVHLLVRDDGSKDGTHNILNRYKKEGKIDWYTGPHLNIQKGYYELMRKANEYESDYVAFSDQDDIWDLDKLEAAVKKLDMVRKNIPALYYCGQRLVDQDLNYIDDHILNHHRTLRTRFVLSDFAGCTGVFNRALLNRILEYEPQYMLMHDTWILKVCLCLGGTVLVDPQPHMNYRQHGNNSLGLGHGWKASLKQVDQYLNQYKVEAQMRELIKGYKKDMVLEYRKLAEEICDYRHDLKKKRKLLDKKYINFHSRGLNLTYDLKVLLNKL